MTVGFFQDEDIDYAPGERPFFPGSPGRPFIPPLRRHAYIAAGVLFAITSGLGNTLIQANQGQLLGALGAEANEVAWVPTAYVMSYATMNLLLVRCRQQLGLRIFALISLVPFCLFTAAHLIVGGVGGAIFVHALAGFAGATLLAFSIYYFTSGLPPQKATTGPVLGLALSQVPIPLARLIQPENFAYDHWQSLYATELGLGLLCLVTVLWLRLPPTQRSQAFELLDFVTYPLFAAGIALIIAVIGLGRYEWWTDRDWLGWALVAAVPLLAMALYIEFHRSNPLFDLPWLYKAGLLRFGLLIILLRITLSEQGVLAFGLLTNAGIINDNIPLFCTALVVASVAGVIVSAKVCTLRNIPVLGVIGFSLIAIAAAVDASATNLTRVPQLYVTQMTISFATSFTVAPTLLFGVIRVFLGGEKRLTSWVVVLSISQNVGGLAGIGFLSSLQMVFEKANSVALIDRVQAFDPVVQARIAAGGGGLRGTAALQAAMSRAASILAYNNLFELVGAIAAGAAIYLMIRILLTKPMSLPLPGGAPVR